MQNVQSSGKKAVRYTDQRVETVGRFVTWRLEQLKWLHEAGAPAEKREQFKQELLATLGRIYERKDGWTVKNGMPHNMYWDVADYHLFHARHSFKETSSYCFDVSAIHDSHTAIYYSVFSRDFKKFIGLPEGPMQ